MEKKVISKPLPSKHYFAHNCVRSRLGNTLAALGYGEGTSILEVGCGSGECTTYIQEVSKNITGVDISSVAIEGFRANGFWGLVADAKRLPFRANYFDCVVASGLLHHLGSQEDLVEYLVEFVRVIKQGGYIVALEPNLFNHSGLLMNFFNTIKPGITGLDPCERALSPLRLVRVFEKSSLKGVEYIAASYVWNRFPLCISKLISRYDGRVRLKWPFNLFGWWEIVYGKKEVTNAW